MMRLLLLLVLFFSFGFTPALPVDANLVVTTSPDAVEQVVYVTKTGKKYHKGSCHHLRQSKIKTTQSAAEKSGYTACKVCKP